jgi:sugar lactone lactonase YvrE
MPSAAIAPCFEHGEGEKPAPDGICLDADGAVWSTDVLNQRCVRVAQGGRVLQTMAADRGYFACMLGDRDGRTLFITANRWTQGRASEGIVLSEGVEVPYAGRP